MIWQSVIGLAAFTGLAWVLGGLWQGGFKRPFPLRVVLGGLGLQADREALRIEAEYWQVEALSAQLCSELGGGDAVGREM